MAYIRHRVGVSGRIEDVWRAIADPAGLAGWWASSASISGDLVSLTFEGLTRLRFRVLGKHECRQLRLENIDGPEPWAGSTLEFQLEESESQVFVTLIHKREDATDDEFQFFMTKWPLFLVSLKQYVETGSGRPYPSDIKIQADL